MVLFTPYDLLRSNLIYAKHGKYFCALRCTNFFPHEPTQMKLPLRHATNDVSFIFCSRDINHGLPLCLLQHSSQ